MLTIALAGGKGFVTTGGVGGVGAVVVEPLQPTNALVQSTTRHVNRILRQ